MSEELTWRKILGQFTILRLRDGWTSETLKVYADEDIVWKYFRTWKMKTAMKNENETITSFKTYLQENGIPVEECEE